MVQKIRVKKHEEKARSANVMGFIKKHPHRKHVWSTRRKHVKHAGVSGYERKA